MGGCDGPNSKKWSDTMNMCVDTALQTSCDTVNQTTCYYAMIQFAGEDGGWLSGEITESGQLKVHSPGPLEKLGLAEGMTLEKLNGNPFSAERMSQFTPEHPATHASLVTTETLQRLLNITNVGANY